MLALILTLFPALLWSQAISTANGDAKNFCPDRELKTARYDDLPFVEGSFNPIPPHYYGLSYTTFQVDQYDGWFPATSGNHTTIAFRGSGNISIPDSPPNQTFDLHKFAYACVSGVPQPACAISVWGWKLDGQTIDRIITFPKLDPGHALRDFKMNQTKFGADWHSLKSIGFSIARKDNGEDMYGGLALDDLQYTITTQC